MTFDCCDCDESSVYNSESAISIYRETSVDKSFFESLMVMIIVTILQSEDKAKMCCVLSVDPSVMLISIVA